MLWVVPGIVPLCVGLVPTSKSYLEWKLSLALFLFLRIIYLAVWGLRCCLPTSSSCREQQLLFTVVRGFSSQWLLFLWSVRTRALAPQLRTRASLWPVGSSQTGDQTPVPCTGRRILNYQTTGKPKTSLQLFSDSDLKFATLPKYNRLNLCISAKLNSKD